MLWFDREIQVPCPGQRQKSVVTLQMTTRNGMLYEVRPALLSRGVVVVVVLTSASVRTPLCFRSTCIFFAHSRYLRFEPDSCVSVFELVVFLSLPTMPLHPFFAREITLS
jgi:hypothetical protein